MDSTDSSLDLIRRWVDAVNDRDIDALLEVVVIGVARGTGASGVELQWRQGYVWTIEVGRAVRFQWFNDPAEALEASGL